MTTLEIPGVARRSEFIWEMHPRGAMTVPVVLFATESLMRSMDAKVFEQAANVASLPGIVDACYVMPDAHWGYGFPIGGVAAFDAKRGGVVSAGGVGFDISCGVRALRTGLDAEKVAASAEKLVEELFRTIPAGVGSEGRLRLDDAQMEAMLVGGARWAVERGHGRPEDLEFIEERGCMAGARPGEVSLQAKKRQRPEMGTLGSGNHYLEVQRVAYVLDEDAAAAYGIVKGQALVSIHCGSRGLGHQIGTDFLMRMAAESARRGPRPPDRELACAPIDSDLGQSYLGAMRAAVNCALANRQMLTHLARMAFAAVLPEADLSLIYDVSHNTCKVETHGVGKHSRPLHVHRKGATRAFGPGHPDLPEAYRAVGQPVLIGGTMGTASYVLAGTKQSEALAWSSACHGAGRAMSRHEAARRWSGRRVAADLAARGILIRSASLRGVAEEAPGAYKDVTAVVEAADRAGLARAVARLEPILCVKG
ncbi:MAG: RtcB family protein [Elusimicrobia bacterium]|nr:RtcB family protein [Elusimicrobiota bacterium]